MTKRYLVFIIVLLTSGCSLLQQAKVHQAMSEKVVDYEYPYDISELQEKLVAALEKKNSPSNLFDSDSPMIVRPAGLDGGGQKAVDIYSKYKKEGFVFNNKIFVPKEIEIGFSDLFKPNTSEHLKNKVSNFINKGDFHILSQDQDQVVLVEGNSIYTISKTSSGSKLQVETIHGVVRKSLSASLDWYNLFTGGFPLSFKRGSIDLKASRIQYASRDPFSELEMLYYMNKKVAKKWEREL